MLKLDNIIRRIAAYNPILHPAGSGTQAAVAFIIRGSEQGPEGLFIVRAHRNGDPWSGNIGFPGGRVEPEDVSLKDTAERETLEEVGVDLARTVHLGRLSDVVGAHLPVRVACFVYLANGELPFLISDEVAEAFWVPLVSLSNPDRQTIAQFHFNDRTVTTPGIILPEPEKPLLWGITYRLVSEFLEIMRQSDNQ